MNSSIAATLVHMTYNKNIHLKLLTYHSEAILGEEAGRGENKAALFLKKFLAEFDITRDILELREI